MGGDGAAWSLEAEDTFKAEACEKARLEYMQYQQTKEGKARPALNHAAPPPNLAPDFPQCDQRDTAVSVFQSVCTPPPGGDGKLPTPTVS